MTERWRCFVGVAVRGELRRSLEAAVDRWRHAPETAGLRWTDPDRWHLTLAFLGEVDASRVPRLAEALDRVAGARDATTHAADTLGGFPSARSATVAWVGLDDPRGALDALARAVRDASDVEDERQFAAHVTVARARGGPVDLRPWVALSPGLTGTLEVDRLELVRTRPSPATLSTSMLRVPAGV